MFVLCRVFLDEKGIKTSEDNRGVVILHVMRYKIFSQMIFLDHIYQQEFLLQHRIDLHQQSVLLTRHDEGSGGFTFGVLPRNTGAL